MIALKPTPAEAYAARMITAIDGFLDNPNDEDWRNDILMFVLERPKTLRSALAAYLYKSQCASQSRAEARKMK